MRTADLGGRMPGALGWRLPRRLAAALLAAAPLHFPVQAASQPAPDDLRALVEVEDIGALAVSPDGRHLAFRSDRASIAHNSYELTWHMVDLATGRGQVLPGAGEPILVDPGALTVEAPIWSPDGRWLYFRALQSGAVQIWRSARDGSGAQAVTAETGDVLSLELAADGRSILYQAGPPRAQIEAAELAEYESGILLDEQVELARSIHRGAVVNGRRATQRLTGGWFSRGNVLWSHPPRRRRLNLTSLAVQDMPPAAGALTSDAEADQASGLHARSARGDVATAAWDGGQGRLTVTRPGRDQRSLACPIAECRNDRVAWLAWRPGHDQLLFATADRALVQTLRLWDLRSGAVRTVLRGDGLINGGRRESAPCALTPSQAVCVRAEPGLPPHLVAIELASGTQRLLHDPNTALRARLGVGTERLAWQDVEGRAFTGVLFLPPGAAARPLPLFINYYRCSGFVRGGVGDEWPFALLAARGIASLCINTTRISGPQDAVGQYRAALAGIEAAIDLLGRRNVVDRRRVGMGGLSFGSEVTQWVLMNSNLIAAASVATPQVEPLTYWFNNMRGRDHYRALRQVWGLGSPDETPARWRLISPALNVERFRAPMLFQIAEGEARYAAEFYARLSLSPTPAEFYIFPDEPHIKVQPRHRQAVYTRNIDWFRFWLQGHADPDPAKAAQYRRWRALAERAAAAQSRQERSHSSSETRSNSR